MYLRFLTNHILNKGGGEMQENNLQIAATVIGSGGQRLDHAVAFGGQR